MKILFYLSPIIIMIGLCLPITFTSKFIMLFGGIIFTCGKYLTSDVHLQQL